MKKTGTEWGIENGTIKKVYWRGKKYDIGNVKEPECELYKNGKFFRTVKINECKCTRPPKMPLGFITGKNIKFTPFEQGVTEERVRELIREEIKYYNMYEQFYLTYKQ